MAQEKSTKKTFAERLAENLRKQADAAIARGEQAKARGAFLAEASQNADDESIATWAQERGRKMVERGERTITERGVLANVTPEAAQALLDSLKQ